MGAVDKVKHKFQSAKGGAKSKVGKAAGNQQAQVEGKVDQVSGDLKQVADKVKDVGK